MFACELVVSLLLLRQKSIEDFVEFRGALLSKFKQLAAMFIPTTKVIRIRKIITTYILTLNDVNCILRLR